MAFLALATGLGIRLAPTLLGWVAKMRSRGALIVGALIFCMALAGLGEKAGLATIVGAFAAGLVLAKTEPRAHIEEALKPVADLFVPIFFVAVGMKVDLSALYPLGPEGGAVLLLAALLVVAAVGSKLLAGVAVWTPAVRRWPVAVGMVPRGEVGLIFAGMGLAAGVMDAGLYAAVVATVMVSTLVVPPWLKLVYAR
ncbi:MAG TPA: cation:proton antiporter [Methylomirabilota bacterium]|nr:cation:proton antiporter [Methylomirabilota bacterium]